MYNFSLKRKHEKFHYDSANHTLISMIKLFAFHVFALEESYIIDTLKRQHMAKAEMIIGG